MKTKSLNGFFDVTIYNAKVEKKDRKVKGEDESIAFVTSFDADKLPAEFAKYAKPYADKNGNNKFRVTFKINQRVRWFDGNAHAVSKPLNNDLNRKRFTVVMDYNQLDGDPDVKEACGYWVNAIMFEELSDNPFEGNPLREQPAAAQGDTVTVVDDLF